MDKETKATLFPVPPQGGTGVPLPELRVKVEPVPFPTVIEKPTTLKQNPKDLLGMKKVSFTKLPATAVAFGNMAMMDGAVKYGPYNWRENAVVVSIYIDAAMRHLNAWFDGEEAASDSKVHHLGHAMACISILIDAMVTGNLIDDRPTENRGAFAKLLETLNQQVKEKYEKTV